MIMLWGDGETQSLRGNSKIFERKSHPLPNSAHEDWIHWSTGTRTYEDTHQAAQELRGRGIQVAGPGPQPGGEYAEGVPMATSSQQRETNGDASERSLGKTRNCAGQQVSGLEFKGGNLVFFLLSFYFKLWHWFVGTIINHGLSKITELGILVDMECSCRPITPQQGRAPAIKRGFFPPPTKRDLRGTSISLLQEVFTSVIFVVKSVNVHVLSSK